YRISGKKWSVKKADGDDLSITIKKLKAGKKYDVRIRAYVKHDSKTFYSPWSNTARSAKVKK
ncbi:MAG: fibronectin type III domain-containing protein, partial [Clostridiales Family XIII bacterium]|nr:fibronectin type III domain-containing protein [Clostridiales Family XIII bacterium]